MHLILGLYLQFFPQINGITGNRDPDHAQETFPADNDADASERLAKLAKMGKTLLL